MITPIRDLRGAVDNEYAQRMPKKKSYILYSVRALPFARQAGTHCSTSTIMGELALCRQPTSLERNHWVIMLRC